MYTQSSPVDTLNMVNAAVPMHTLTTHDTMYMTGCQIMLCCDSDCWGMLAGRCACEKPRGGCKKGIACECFAAVVQEMCSEAVRQLF